MNWLRFTKGFLLSFVFLFFFVYMIAGIQWIFDDSLQGNNKKMFYADISDSVQNIVPQDTSESIVPPIPKPEINAESAISIESNLLDVDKIIFEKDTDKKLPIASLTKLMTAVVVLDNYNLSDVIEVNKIADAQEPIKQDVKSGDIMPVESFLDIMLISSSNKSAYALSEKIGEKKFVDLMNKKSKEIGLKNTFFADPTGLNYKNISTVNDLAKLAEYILKNYPKIAEISSSKELDIPEFGKIINTDHLLNEIPDIICSKTGFTIEANGCLLLVINNSKNNDYLINIILNSDDRFGEMKKMINWVNTTQNCNEKK